MAYLPYTDSCGLLEVGFLKAKNGQLAYITFWETRHGGNCSHLRVQVTPLLRNNFLDVSWQRVSGMRLGYLVEGYEMVCSRAPFDSNRW